MNTARYMTSLSTSAPSDLISNRDFFCFFVIGRRGEILIGMRPINSETMGIGVCVLELISYIASICIFLQMCLNSKCIAEYIRTDLEQLWFDA